MGEYLMVLAYLPWIRIHAGRLLGQLNQIGKTDSEQPDVMPGWQVLCGQARASSEYRKPRSDSDQNPLSITPAGRR